MSASHTNLRSVSIGGATFDLFLKTEDSMLHHCDGTESLCLPLGHKVRLKDAVGASGGGANNTATALKRLGCHASFMGILSVDAWGLLLQQVMQKEGVDCSSATIVENENSSLSIILSAESGERVILTHPGSGKHLHDVTFDKSAVAKTDIVYLNHLHRESCEIENDLVSELKANPHVRLTWNPGGTQIKQGFAHDCNRDLCSVTAVLLLNSEEAETFTGKTDLKEIFAILHQAGAKVVCITDGPKGAFGSDGKTIYHCPALPCSVVDMTGAGDSFGSAVSWALASGKDLPFALRAGTMNAMSVVCTIGAQAGLLTDTQMHSALTTHADQLRVTTL